MLNKQLLFTLLFAVWLSVPAVAEELEVTLVESRQMQVELAGVVLKVGERVIVPRSQMSLNVMTLGPIRENCLDPGKRAGKNTEITASGPDGCAWEVHSGTYHGYARWNVEKDSYRYTPAEYFEVLGPESRARINPPTRANRWNVTMFGDTAWNYKRSSQGRIVKKDEKEDGFAALSIIVRAPDSPFPPEGTPIAELQAQQLAETIETLYDQLKDKSLVDLLKAPWEGTPPLEPVDHVGRTPVYPVQAEILDWWKKEVTERLKYNPHSPFSDPALFFLSRGWFNLTRNGNDSDVVRQHGLGRCGDVYQFTNDHFDDTFPKNRGKILGLVSHFDLLGVYGANHVTNVIPPVDENGELKSIDKNTWHNDWKKTRDLSGTAKQSHIDSMLKKYDGAIVIDSWTRRSMPLKEWVSNYRNRNDAIFVGARGSELED